MKTQSFGSFISRSLIRIFLAFWSLTVIFPLVWLVYSSLKNNREFYESPWKLPDVLRLENYQNAWVTANISSYFLNSLIVVFGALVFYLIMSTTTSYILAKYKFRSVKFFQNFYLAAMMIPGVLLLVPLYYQMLALKLTDRLITLIILYAVQGVPFAVFILTGFIKNIHNSFIEAALVDGASEFNIFTKIILPFIKAPIFIVSLLNIMGSWNEFTTALTFIRDETKYTVPIGLSYLANTMQYRTDFGALFASLVISMVPVLVLYAFFQKQLQEGTAANEGVKG